MFFQDSKRIFRWGIVNFLRNGVVSFSSVLVMVVALFMVGSTILLSVFLNATLKDLENKIDINVYFNVDAKEDNILSFKSSLEALPEISSVAYVSKEAALDEFKERHKNDELTIQAIKELDENPLRAYFSIKAVSLDQYDKIAQSLTGDTAISLQYGEGFIDKINYQGNSKTVIERMKKLINSVEMGGVAVIFVLIIISILITFNTIRLAIYISKDEINVMRLVGAGNMYIRGPFVVAGSLYGVVAALITVGLFYPITLSIKQHTADLYGGIDLFQYYISNFSQIFLIILVSGVTLGAISSYLAVRRYLRK